MYLILCFACRIIRLSDCLPMNFVSAIPGFPGKHATFEEGKVIQVESSSNTACMKGRLSLTFWKYLRLKNRYRALI